MKKIASTIVMFLMVFSLFACGGNKPNINEELQEITNVTLNNKTVTYNGEEHSIQIEGTLPSGVAATYVNNNKSAVGSYQITATLGGKGYKTKTLTATLIIVAQIVEDITFGGITFDNYVVDYDSFEHEVVVSGVVPSGALVNYNSDVNGVTNKASEVGIYNITATLTKTGYTTLTLNARLTIRAVDKERFIHVKDGNIYYNNGLDKENLYVYNQDGHVKINNDEAQFIIRHNDIMYYVSNGLISTSIKSFSGSAAQTVYSANAQFLISDGLAIYYAVNTLFGQSGIYKLNLDAEEPVVTKVFSGKAKYLTLVDNDVYFANGNDAFKLYRISKNFSNGIATLVLDEKIKELTYFNGSLYFTVNNLLGDYLARLILASNTIVKLTSDNAKYITISGGYVYYSNVDLINTQIYGKGLYRVPVNSLVNNLGAGELVYQTEYHVSSLYAQDNQTILFYRLSDIHLLSLNTQTKVVTDLMADFTSPAENVAQPLSKFETFVWQNRVYYINNYVEGALFYYDTKSNQSIRVTASGVKSFSISGDYLYFNQISWLVDNDIYMINLRQGGLPQKISNNDGRDMVVHNGYLYYVKENSVGVGTAINKLTLNDPFEEAEIYPYNAHNLIIKGDKLYFIKGAGVDEIWRADLLANGDLSNIIRLGTSKTDWFILVGDSIYYRDVGTISKTLSKINLDGTSKTVVISGYDPISFIVKDGSIYFTNDTAFGPKDGIYKANLDGTGIQLLFENTNNDGFGIEMQIAGNYLYYYSKSGILGDYKLHRLNLTALISEELD